MLKISFTDFWNGFDQNNNLITNIIKELFNSSIKITLLYNAFIGLNRNTINNYLLDI